MDASEMAHKKCSAANMSNTYVSEKSAATRSASRPPPMPPSVPAPVILPKTCLAVRGSNDSDICDQKPERRIAPNATMWR